MSLRVMIVVIIVDLYSKTGMTLWDSFETISSLFEPRKASFVTPVHDNDTFGQMTHFLIVFAKNLWLLLLLFFCYYGPTV